MNILNTAIIGAGAIHSCHVNALRQIPNVALRALVDIDSVKGLKLAMNYQCRFYQDYREMLLDDSIDVVHICTPHFEHKNMILAALAAGKHVFCEKPVGMNSSELADIASAAAQAPGRLGVCYQNRLNPTSLRIRKELAEGVLGKMLSINYQTENIIVDHLPIMVCWSTNYPQKSFSIKVYKGAELVSLIAREGNNTIVTLDAISLLLIP